MNKLYLIVLVFVVAACAGSQQLQPLATEQGSGYGMMNPQTGAAMAINQGGAGWGTTQTPMPGTAEILAGTPAGRPHDWCTPYHAACTHAGIIAENAASRQGNAVFVASVNANPQMPAPAQQVPQTQTPTTVAPAAPQHAASIEHARDRQLVIFGVRLNALEIARQQAQAQQPQPAAQQPQSTPPARQVAPTPQPTPQNRPQPETEPEW